MSTGNSLSLDFLLESYIDNEVIPKSEAMRDRFGSYWLHRQDLGDKESIRFGRVVDYVPYANAYKVQADQQSTIWCTSLVDTGLQPFGAKSLNTIPAGAGVFYLWYRNSHWGYILNVVPDFMTDREKGQSDYISPGSRCGLLVEQAHKNLLNLQYRGGVVNWSSGRPVDATGVGEWGAMTETGLAFFLDPYMAFMRVNEETGIWAFMYDQLLRIAGQNLQIRTHLRDMYEFDDEDEASMVCGKTPYTWERLGQWSWGNSQAYRAPTSLETQGSNPELTRLEPAYTDQQAFMRRLDFEGYLGQGGTRSIALPPCPLPENLQDLNRFSVERRFPGAFEEHIALTGAYSLRSAKRVILSKRWGVTPKQTILPEDARGDTSDNYRAGGLLGAGEEHIIKGELSTDYGETLPEQLVRAVGSVDSEVWGFNWANLHQFHYHARDWYLPEHNDLPCSIGSADSIAIGLLELASSQYMSDPVPVEIYVDHRYGAVKYWLNESVFALNDDGGVSLIDGYGAEWRSTGGNLEIFAPADITLHAGRSFNVLAGKDINLRANKSIDVISNNKDIRLKAEHNIMALAGNDGCGGILLESRAVCPAYDFDGVVGEDAILSGVFIKTCSSRFVVRASDVVMESNCVDAYNGQFIIETNGGRIQTHADFIENFIQSAKIDLFVDDSGYVLGGNEWWQNQTILGAPLSVYGCVHSYGLHSKGDIIVVDGHIGTDQAETNNYAVSQLNNASTINAQFTQLDIELNELVISTGPVEYDFAAYTALKNVHKSVEYSLRTTSQYGTEGYIVLEGRWQQTARICEHADVWIENPVTTHTVDHEVMYPWPGPEVWCGNYSYRTYDPKYRESIENTVLDRLDRTNPNDPVYEGTEAYQGAKFAVTGASKPDGNYVIPIL